MPASEVGEQRGGAVIADSLDHKVIDVLGVHPGDCALAISGKHPRAGDTSRQPAAVVGDHWRVRDQHALVSRGGAAGGDQPCVIRSEAQEGGNECHSHESRSRDGNDSNDGRVPVEGDGCQQCERGQGGVEVAVAAGVSPDRDKPEHRRQVNKGREMEEPQGGALAGRPAPDGRP